MSLLIPRTINYIWLGKKPMHPLMNGWRQKWESLHPRWEIKIWSESPGNPTSLICQHETLDSSFPKLLQDSCHLSQRTNIWRYELLHRLGGLYLDTDFEPIKSLDPLIDGLEAFAGRCYTINSPDTQIGCSIIGCIPEHTWMRDLIDNLKHRDPRISRSMGSDYFGKITSYHPEVHLFDPDVFYSQRWEQPAHYKPPLPAAAYAVHRWSSKWFPEGFKPLQDPPSIPIP
jgi:inositol phosphorylceramide mannosyltransferase catalytic subunit